jgi:hypothetical protein
MSRILRNVVLALIIFWIFLLLTGWKILITEKRVSKGETYPEDIQKDYGKVNPDGDSLYCRYFNGRVLSSKVFWYSPNDLLGKSSCPTWITEKSIEDSKK